MVPRDSQHLPQLSEQLPQNSDEQLPGCKNGNFLTNKGSKMGKKLHIRILNSFIH